MQGGHTFFSWILGKRGSGYLGYSKNTQYQQLLCLFTQPNTFLRNLDL